jgi:hypothetical protein
MGACTPGFPTGISVSTSMDYASGGAASGALGGRVTGVSLTIQPRLPGTFATVSVTFTTTAPIAAGGSIEFSYPDNFFATNIFPNVYSAFVNVGVATAGALYQGILSGSRLYYLNFDTAA